MKLSPFCAIMKNKFCVTKNSNSTKTYVKSLGKQNTVLQSGQSGFNILNVSFNIKKLCFTSGADNGSTYILNCEIPPSNVPAKFCSNNMFVCKPAKDVVFNNSVEKHSGSWIYFPSSAVQAEKVKFSRKPCVPPPQEMLNGRMGVVRMYNSALTGSQVLQNYNADKTKYGL